MKYRTKLYVALMGTAITSVALGLGIAYYKVRGFLLEELRSKVMSVAAAGAASIDGNVLKTINSTSEAQSANYKQIQRELRAIRDSNRRKDVYVKFVYTLIPTKENREQFYFQVDAEEPTPDFSDFGDPVPDAKDNFLIHHIKEVYSPPHFIINKWGSWMTGYAPIYDSQGNYVATLGVDLKASDIIDKLNKLLTYGLMSVIASLLLALILAFFLSKRATAALQSLYNGVKEIGRGNLNKRIHLKTRDEFDELAQAINRMAKGLQERDRLRSNFARYVSQYVMDSILKTKKPVALAGERRKITLIFSDIRQFTHLSEKLPPEDVVALLNEYFSIMVEIIFKNQGTLDKFIGDGMMIEFGVPLGDELQELHAMNTAIEMLHATKNLNRKWLSEGKPSIEIGIGIHTGIAVVGNIGTERRIEYTAIGDSVNVASRLEQLTKELKTPIILSQSTVDAIKDKFNFESLGPVVLRGRVDPINIYSVKID